MRSSLELDAWYVAAVGLVEGFSAEKESVRRSSPLAGERGAESLLVILLEGSAAAMVVVALFRVCARAWARYISWWMDISETLE